MYTVPIPKVLPPIPRSTCEKCQWWERINESGFCHRYAPRPLNHERGDEWSLPTTRSGGWCGDYKRDTSQGGAA